MKDINLLTDLTVFVEKKEQYVFLQRNCSGFLKGSVLFIASLKKYSFNKYYKKTWLSV